ncbi:MAG TPA: hypothetical protein VFN48_01430, partial [Solirubrobacteraceae bacterium]|nr:hypothetical protein [Solirubrobacteraceae bacterium]
MSLRARHASVGYLLDLEPELAAGLAPGDAEDARALFTGPLLSVAPGGLVARPPGDPAAVITLGAAVITLGLMVVTGIVAREIRLRDRFRRDARSAGTRGRRAAVLTIPRIGGSPDMCTL